MRPQPAEQQAASARILLVEDEPLIRIDTAEDLRSAGFTVIEAADADEALAVLRSGLAVDLVFTDVQMPGRTDGRALAASVRSIRADLPVILTSGTLRPDRLDDADAFIPKPYDARHLVALIRTVLGKPEGPAA